MRLPARPNLLAGVVLTVVTAALLSACAGQVVPGRARPSVDSNVLNVAGLPVTQGPSGLRPGVPDAKLAVQHGTGTSIDKLAVDSLSDIDAYWATALPQDFGKKFVPARKLISYDSQGASVRVCGQSSQGVANAFYCPADDSVSWDRGELLPTLDKLFGPMAIVTVFAHDVGHLVQRRLGVAPATPAIVVAQQADCYTGAVIRWVVDGNAKHFRISTGDGLNSVLSTMMFLRDQIGPAPSDPLAQGSSFDRVTAFQFGFTDGPVRCSQIDESEVRQRVTELGFTPASEANENVPVDTDTLALLQQSLDATFKQGDRDRSPQIVSGNGICADGSGTAPASFCPADDTIAVDTAALNQLAALPAEVGPADPEQSAVDRPAPGPVGPGLGDFAAFAEVASRYAMAVEQSLGIPLDDKNAGLRTACLTGAWAGVIRHDTTLSSAQQLLLGPGDLDEAVAELLSPSSVIAADVHGSLVPAGFARVSSFQDGFLQGWTVCTAQFG